ncbi:hypothetical protein [Haloplanus salilacus]|uniref:hypothetical protein n=1 Tax=Haloplanus salilacus TaxID=2949994 RepID=UPI0030D54B3E
MSSPPVPSQSAGNDAPDGRKSTLFCPDCGHASPADGDWDVRTVASRRRLRCPECRCVIDRRDAGRVPARARPFGAPARWCADAWSRCLSAWSTLVVGRRSADC